MDMNAVPEPFSYDSVLAGRMIRLLRISPASGADAIHLSQSSKALYVWGSSEATETAIYNEKTLRITENLHTALLWQMREDGRKGYI